MTPEATLPLLDRQAPGLVHAMLSASLRVVPTAMLSRPAAGIRKQTWVLAPPAPEVPAHPPAFAHDAA